MEQITWLDKDKTLPTSDVRRLWREEDIDELKTKFNANVVEAEAHETATDAHASATNNPHSVTKAQVGLSNVDNTSDADKPISSATQAALNAITSGASFVKRETPSGAVPGSAFATAFPLVAGSEEFFRNGILQDITTSYTITGQNITTATTVEAWESLKINYIKS